ncbi:group III truncated hemoglobin [Bartonella sp. HY761]|uniref:group III truncated hemoglobin n=1 Tax=Bartonella sp. HY761 TaxID=2979330 RepID=UPI00220DCB34|nr:group III truncated hemoglobin [Bartonella sp. HY761]UXN05874.1 group III truncated hemoglobin [Bartonella sp. HY761]
MTQTSAVDEVLIETVVRHFYDRVRADALLGPIFEEKIKNWEPHLQQMFAFWSAVMLHSGRYEGRPMPKHVVLDIDAQHFDHWLDIFRQTVDDLCLPHDAEIFKQKATHIAKSLEMGVAHFNGASTMNGERYYRNKD